MKIQLGKRYGDTEGNEWLVECKLAQPPFADRPYVASCVALGHAAYYGQDGSTDPATPNYSFVPELVAYTGYAIVYRSNKGGTHKLGRKIYASKEAAMRDLGHYNQTRGVLAVVPVQYEAEEF
jgi:hypothetical protein